MRSEARSATARGSARLPDEHVDARACLRQPEEFGVDFGEPRAVGHRCLEDQGVHFHVDPHLLN